MAFHNPGRAFGLSLLIEMLFSVGFSTVVGLLYIRRKRESDGHPSRRFSNSSSDGESAVELAAASAIDPELGFGTTTALEIGLRIMAAIDILANVFWYGELTVLGTVSVAHHSFDLQVESDQFVGLRLNVVRQGRLLCPTCTTVTHAGVHPIWDATPEWGDYLHRIATIVANSSQSFAVRPFQ